MNIDINGVSITLTDEQLAEIQSHLPTEEIGEPFWEPQDGETAWCLNLGNASPMQSNNWLASTPCNRNIINSGEVFKSEREAKHALELKYAKQRLKKEIYRLNGNCFPKWDWTDVQDCRCLVSLYPDRLDVNIVNRSKFAPNWMYLKTEELAKQLIESHRDDLLLVLGE
ncbi:MAG: hypothetical protein U9Q38_06435 [Thermodesulfobacteriota bacterium]|nr:hypothetical protein [Thermodesulfobacteriota bacterium]